MPVLRKCGDLYKNKYQVLPHWLKQKDPEELNDIESNKPDPVIKVFEKAKILENT